MQFVCQDGRLHKFLNETLCNFTIDKRPQVWYNWRADNGPHGPNFRKVNRHNKQIFKWLFVQNHQKNPEIASLRTPYAPYATAGRWRSRRPVFRPQTPYAKFFLESQGAARPDHFPGIVTQPCQNLPHMHKPYGRSYSVVNPEEQRLLTRNDVHMVDFYLKFCYNIIGGNIFSDR